MVILIIILLLEVIFRFWYYLKYKRSYHISIKIPWKDSYVIPNPFLSFSYKRNSIIDKNQKLPYPLHTNKFYSFKDPLHLNNIGHFGKNIKLKKSKIRILCLGASTTANNISDGKQDYTYPKLLQKYLGNKYEVVNCGIGGWTSIDILINFQLNLLQYKPDMIILYHGYNDLAYHLMDNIKTDYSHGRKNLGEVIYKIKRSYFLPKIKFFHLYEFFKDKIFGTGNVRNDVMFMINKQQIDYLKEFKTLQIEKNIIENLYILCKHHNIKILSSTLDGERAFRSYMTLKKLGPVRNSVYADQSVATTGKPQTAASSIGNPKPSPREALANAQIFLLLYKLVISSRVIDP